MSSHPFNLLINKTDRLNNTKLASSRTNEWYLQFLLFLPLYHKYTVRKMLQDCTMTKINIDLYFSMAVDILDVVYIFLFSALINKIQK